MKTAAAILVAMLAFGSASASAQTYAGKWEASGTSMGMRGKCPRFDARIKVVGNDITIAISSGGNYKLKGTVAADGSFKANGPNTTASGKFAGDTVEIQLNAGCGERSGTGSRAS